MNSSNTLASDNPLTRDNAKDEDEDDGAMSVAVVVKDTKTRQEKHHLEKKHRKDRKPRKEKKRSSKEDESHGRKHVRGDDSSTKARKKKGSRRDRYRDDRRSHRYRHRRHRRNDDDGSYNTTGNSASSRDIDDSIGHFEGGPNTIIDRRYKVVKDVGMGTFGRVVQAIDLKVRDRDRRKGKEERDNNNGKSEIVAIKIVRNIKRYHQSALIEADILKDVNTRGGRGRSLCAVMQRHFEFDGHCCLVFEKLGRNLYDFLKRHDYAPFPLFCVRDFARQLLDALDFIHGLGLIHTDLKPENILFVSNKERSYRNVDGSKQQIPASTSIKLIDFGGATYENEKKSSIINTRQYRAPEVILGLGWSMPSDLWSAGCIIAELYIGELLFATHDNAEHLALIELIIGRFPLDMLTRSKEFGTTVFDTFGFHKMELSEESKSHVRSRPPLKSVVNERDQTSGLVGLLKSLLMIDPVVRTTAGDALKSTFLEHVPQE
jgi:dual-specificity kinase/CDC-like kinase